MLCKRKSRIKIINTPVTLHKEYTEHTKNFHTVSALLLLCIVQFYSHVLHDYVTVTGPFYAVALMNIGNPIIWIKLIYDNVYSKYPIKTEPCATVIKHNVDRRCMNIKTFHIHSQIAKFMGPTWGPPGSCRPQISPMLAPWTLLSGFILPYFISKTKWMF